MELYSSFLPISWKLKEQETFLKENPVKSSSSTEIYIYGTFFRNILQLLRNIMGLNNHNLSHKTLKQVTKHFTENFIS